MFRYHINMHYYLYYKKLYPFALDVWRVRNRIKINSRVFHRRLEFVMVSGAGWKLILIYSEDLRPRARFLRNISPRHYQKDGQQQFRV